MYRALAFDIQQMFRGNKKLRVLSFPGPTWTWEMGLAELFSDKKFEFTGLERDEGVWDKLCSMASLLSRNFKMYPEPIDFEGYIATRDKRNKPFDIVYLDWMGTWSKEKKRDIECLLESDLLAPGGVLILTVSLRRGRPETMDELHDLSYDLPVAFYDARGEDKYVSNVKVRGIPHWVQERARDMAKVKLRPIMASVYYSSTGISNQVQPQLQLMFLREN